MSRGKCKTPGPTSGSAPLETTRSWALHWVLEGRGNVKYVLPSTVCFARQPNPASLHQPRAHCNHQSSHGSHHLQDRHQSCWAGTQASLVQPPQDSYTQPPTTRAHLTLYPLRTAQDSSHTGLVHASACLHVPCLQCLSTACPPGKPLVILQSPV